MNRRTFEGPMDWEYQNSRGPVDASSPFSQIPQRSFLGSSPGKPINPFAAASTGGGMRPHAAPPSPSKQPFSRPPSSSMFSVPGAKTFPTASPFRNPAFTTPQKRVEDIMSECSGAEESPAVQSDASMLGDDTPDVERVGDEFARATMTPASAVSRRLFNDRRDSESTSMSVSVPASPAQSSHAPGRGEVPRGKLDHLFGRRDRVRKRRRQLGDKDVGSGRSRFHGGGVDTTDESDDSDASAWNDGGSGSRRRGGRTGRRGAAVDKASRGAVGNLFSAIHDHPNVPLILSWWVQLGMNVFFMSVVMWFVWGGISMMRADISHAADAARSRLLAQMNECAHEYTKNRCAPKNERLPALNVMCNEWEVCMNQDPSSVMKMQVSAKNVAEIINEFVGVMSFKAWGFILSAMLAVILASNLGFSRFRDAAFVDQSKTSAAGSYAPQAGGAPAPSLPPSQDPSQAYIWAPIGQTPRHIRREFMLQPDTPTDTDGSPDVSRTAIMPPPQTPSTRRSPNKGERERERERERSPTKVVRSPIKAY